MNPGRYADTFRKTQAFDGYNPSLPLFKCKFTPFDDSPSDGSTGERRVLDAHPDTPMPARRVVTLHAEQWLVGDDNTDDFFGTPTSKHYGMKKATNRLAMAQPGTLVIEAARPLATGVADYTSRFPVATLPWAYAHRLFFKSTLDPQTTASYDNFWSFFVAPGEPAKKRWLLRDLDSGTLHLVRNLYSPPQDLVVLQADELDEDAVQLITVQRASVYDPITDTVARKNVVVPAVRLDFSKDYQYRTEADALGKAGDELLLVPKVALEDSASTLDMDFTGDTYNYWGWPAVAMQDVLTMLGRDWRVVSFVSQLDCWKLHVRRA